MLLPDRLYANYSLAVTVKPETVEGNGTVPSFSLSSKAKASPRDFAGSSLRLDQDRSERALPKIDGIHLGRQRWNGVCDRFGL